MDQEANTKRGKQTSENDINAREYVRMHARAHTCTRTQ